MGLYKLQHEKAELEQHLEQEQEFQVNKLMKKIKKLENDTISKQLTLEQKDDRRSLAFEDPAPGRPVLRDALVKECDTDVPQVSTLNTWTSLKSHSKVIGVEQIGMANPSFTPGVPGFAEVGSRSIAGLDCSDSKAADFMHIHSGSDVKQVAAHLHLRREKIDLENTLEQEQEALVNRLWKRMDKLEAEKRILQEKLDQPVSAPPSPRDISMEIDSPENMMRHIRFLKNEVERLKKQLRAAQLQRLAVCDFLPQLYCFVVTLAKIEKAHGENSFLRLSPYCTIRSLKRLQILTGEAVCQQGAAEKCSGNSLLRVSLWHQEVLDLLKETLDPRKVVSSPFQIPGGGCPSGSAGVQHRAPGLVSSVLGDGCYSEKMAQYLEEERHMREENLRLQRKLQREMERREALCRQLSESESSLEMDDERYFNEMSAQGLRPRTVSSPIPYTPSPSSSRPISPGEHYVFGYFSD
ncbi:hypothetical protein P7K49_024049 [Saguinus oedipus]|uniref:Uncharacterized protein n=1 Tax=Saguinus oedipus TaxID=9490 RepID=A0ABQ9UNF6_SAGOE|nr:hypothetical protein P7K49_024049 [Saguinus oedipus]